MLIHAPVQRFKLYILCCVDDLILCPRDAAWRQRTIEINRWKQNILEIIAFILELKLKKKKNKSGGHLLNET